MFKVEEKINDFANQVGEKYLDLKPFSNKFKKSSILAVEFINNNYIYDDTNENIEENFNDLYNNYVNYISKKHSSLKLLKQSTLIYLFRKNNFSSRMRNFNSHYRNSVIVGIKFKPNMDNIDINANTKEFYDNNDKLQLLRQITGTPKNEYREVIEDDYTSYKNGLLEKEHPLKSLKNFDLENTDNERGFKPKDIYVPNYQKNTKSIFDDDYLEISNTDKKESLLKFIDDSLAFQHSKQNYYMSIIGEKISKLEKIKNDIISNNNNVDYNAMLKELMFS